MKEFKVRLTFKRDVIGSQPSNEDIKKDYIMSKMLTGRTGMSADVAQSRIKEEIENLKKDPEYQKTIEQLDDKTLTVFYRNNEGIPCISDIQLRGFFKDSFAFVARENKWLTKKDGTNYSGDAKYRDWIGDRISFNEQYIPIKDKEVKIMQRPLRCETMQGPRVTLSSSEYISAPFSINFSFKATDDVKDDMIKAVLDRGEFKGIGQWANAQWGTFVYELMCNGV